MSTEEKFHPNQALNMRTTSTGSVEDDRPTGKKVVTTNAEGEYPFGARRI